MTLQKGNKIKFIKIKNRLFRTFGLEPLGNLLLGVTPPIPKDSYEVEPVPVTKIFFLARRKGPMTVHPLSKTTALHRLECSQRGEFTWRTNLLIVSYAYLTENFSISELEAKEKEFLVSLISKCELYDCCAPDPYKFIDLIKENV